MVRYFDSEIDELKKQHPNWKAERPSLINRPGSAHSPFTLNSPPLQARISTVCFLCCDLIVRKPFPTTSLITFSRMIIEQRTTATFLCIKTIEASLKTELSQSVYAGMSGPCLICSLFTSEAALQMLSVSCCDLNAVGRRKKRHWARLTLD